MREQQSPGAFYGANIKGESQAAHSFGGGDDRSGGSARRKESTMNIPHAEQIPIEGAVTGPEAPPIKIDEVYARANLDDLG